ncbi:14634_t:CDS:1, partial [Cetraspora pellucida]
LYLFIAWFIDTELNNFGLYLWNLHNEKIEFLEVVGPYNVTKKFLGQHNASLSPDTKVDDITINTIKTPVLGGDENNVQCFLEKNQKI